jgi:outer membrane lipoprotein-sorting protein
MLLHNKLLFELPVYRKNETSYLQDFETYKKTIAYSVTIDDFGGSWEYNEIIGYLKFYISGKTQIRVEYKETYAKRKVKTKKKTFILNSDSFCVRAIFKNMDNLSLIKLIRECIEHCKIRLPKRYINTTFIDNTLDHTDWKSVIK